MEQPSTYAWRGGSSPWPDYKYNMSTSNAEEEEEEEEEEETSLSVLRVGHVTHLINDYTYIFTDC